MKYLIILLLFPLCVIVHAETWICHLNNNTDSTFKRIDKKHFSVISNQDNNKLIHEVHEDTNENIILNYQDSSQLLTTLINKDDEYRIIQMGTINHKHFFLEGFCKKDI